MALPSEIIKDVSITIRVADFAIKHLPSIVRISSKFIIDKKILKDVTYERISLEKISFSAKEKNEYSISFLNHVIRSSYKVNRKISRGGKRAKITHPQLPEEKALVDFHTTDQLRLDYVGAYSRTLSDNTLEKITNNEVEENLYIAITRSKSSRKNSIYYVEGSIGCGKSTLLSTIATRVIINRRNETIQKTANKLKLDVCIVSFEDLTISKEIESAEDLLNVFHHVIYKEIIEQVDVSGSNIYEVLKDSGNNRRFTLIIDGIDFLYTAFCRLCFELDNNLTLYYKALYMLIEEFTNGELSDLGINMIISFRNETLDIIRNTSEEISGIHRVDIPDNNIYSLLEVPKEKLIEVFEKRINYVESKKEKCEPVLVSDRGYFEYYNGVAIHGLRHIMDTWEKAFSLIPTKKINDRLFEDPRMFKIFFLTSGVGHYSQVNHGLTNIFLVNPNFRAEGGDIKVVEAIEMDKQTYWLKYFVLANIVKSNTDRTSVIDLFSSKSKYSPSLIRIILMGFSEIEHGRILKPNISRFNGHTVTTVGLEVTSRGRESINSGLFFSFEYLCCIVEDTYLRVPSSILEKFKNPSSLGFLTNSDDEAYSKKRFEYIKEKACSVMTFISVLEESYKLEKKRDPDLFKIFESDRYKDYVPNFEAIRINSIKAIGELIEAYSPSERKEIKTIIVKSQGIIEREIVRRSLSSIIK